MGAPELLDDHDALQKSIEALSELVSMIIEGNLPLEILIVIALPR